MLKYIKLLPVVLELIKAIETMIPGEKNGKEKLDLALSTARAAYDGEEEVRAAWGNPEKLAGAVATQASAAVTVLNTLGVFKSSTPATEAVK